MKIKRFMVILLVVAFIISSFCGCSPNKQRVEKAMEKLASSDAIYMQAHITLESYLEAYFANGTGSKQFQTSSIDASFDIKQTDDGSRIAIKYKSGQTSFTFVQYMMGDTILVSYPEIFSGYIDCSSIYQDSMDTEKGMLDTLEFDPVAASLSYSDTTIVYQGNKTDVLMVMVILNDKQLTNMIQDLLVQQSVQSGTLSGSDPEQIAKRYEDIKVDSVEYALFIDDDDNILRFYLKASVLLGESAKTDLIMQFDILDTGDAIAIDFPDVETENVIPYETLLAMARG